MSGKQVSRTIAVKGYKIFKTSKHEDKLFTRLSSKYAKRYGAIGYLRGNFGNIRNDFVTTWFYNQTLLKTFTFKLEFNKVIDYLYEILKSPTFKGFDDFTIHCLESMKRYVLGTEIRFKMKIKNYSYYISFYPRQGMYDFYCIAFHNRYLLPELPEQPTEKLSIISNKKCRHYSYEFSDDYDFENTLVISDNTNFGGEDIYEI